MARPQIELQELLEGLTDVKKAYQQPPTTLEYPCILYERDDSFVTHADNLRYLFKKRYSVTVMDRNPNSIIPDQVEALRYARINRTFRKDGLNHWVYTLYF